MGLRDKTRGVPIPNCKIKKTPQVIQPNPIGMPPNSSINTHKSSKNAKDVNYYMATRSKATVQTPSTSPLSPQKSLSLTPSDRVDGGAVSLRTESSNVTETQESLQRALSSKPSDPSPMLPSGRASMRSEASALTTPSSIQVKSQDGRMLFNIKPSQNDPALKKSDKRTYSTIPSDHKCEKCGFQGKSYDSIKTHRSRGCGETKKIECPICGKIITAGNSYHMNKCKNK